MPELSQVVHLLRKVPLFEGLAAVELAHISRAAQYVEVRRDGVFFREGAPAAVVYVLLHGRVKLTQLTGAAHEVLLAVVGPGECFGTTAALGNHDYPFSARAIRGCRALAWRGEVMAGLMESYPRIALNALNDLVERIEEWRTRYRELATEPVEQRVAQALLRLATKAGWQTDDGVLIDLPLSRQELAEIAGTTLFTASRVLRSWARAGYVDAGRQYVAILQVFALTAIAQGSPAAPVSSYRRKTAAAPHG